MGVVFFFALVPLLIALLVIMAVMAITGIVILIVGISGSIASAAAIGNKRIKAVSLLFFIALLLLGLSCLAALIGIANEVTAFILPMLVVVGLVSVLLGVVGIIKAAGIEHKVAKVIFLILLALSIILGALVAGAGVFLLLMW